MEPAAPLLELSDPGGHTWATGLRIVMAPGPPFNSRRKRAVRALGGYGAGVSPWLRSIGSLSFGSVSCRKSSAAVSSAVVNGPVGGRPTLRKRSRRMCTRFMSGAYRDAGCGR